MRYHWRWCFCSRITRIRSVACFLDDGLIACLRVVKAWRCLYHYILRTSETVETNWMLLFNNNWVKNPFLVRGYHPALLKCFAGALTVFYQRRFVYYCRIDVSTTSENIHNPVPSCLFPKWCHFVVCDSRRLAGRSPTKLRLDSISRLLSGEWKFVSLIQTARKNRIARVSLTSTGSDRPFPVWLDTATGSNLLLPCCFVAEIGSQLCLDHPPAFLA